MKKNRTAVVTIALVTIAALAGAAEAATPGQTCEKATADALRRCNRTAAKQTVACVKQTGTPCDSGDATIVEALADVAARIGDACPSQQIVTEAGYPAALSPSGLVSRIQAACTDTLASLVARSFGGPQAAALAGASDDEANCLVRAFDQGRKMIDRALRLQSTCISKAHSGGTCDAAAVESKIASFASKRRDAIDSRCEDLSALVAVGSTSFVARARDQAECLVATAHGDSATLDLRCGPRASIVMPPLAVATQIVLDGDEYNTRCGDGGPYAFWLRLAPEGSPPNKVVVFLVGGGNCWDGPSCAGTPADLFESIGDVMTGNAITSSTASTNPFRDWTKVMLPYCTQDVHTGGGITNVFNEMTVHRYGALNVRGSLRYARDVIWNLMDADDPEGYRPDRMTVLLSGSSAGGGGAAFNYHYVLDDLRWVHTTLVPDSSLGMDNGLGATVARGELALATATPGWRAGEMAAPYCFGPQCAEIFPTLEIATSARLKAVPGQQILNVTNQTDNVQRNVGEFSSTAHFVNTMRSNYCAHQNTPGIRSFLYDSTPWIHGMINDNAEYNGDAIDGVLLRDWLGAAMADPGAVTDLVGTGTLETDFPGVAPFPCTLP